MALLMAVAAVWGVLQLFALSWPARSVRLSTVLLALAVGVYGCGVATALLQIAYTRVYAEQSGQSLTEVVATTSYTVAPWLEELLKISPLLLAGLYAKVRRQWGLTDFVVLGGALGAGFGLLEAVLRFGLDADRAIAHDAGGWLVPDSIFPPYIPGPEQVFTAWLPAPFGGLDMIGEPATDTFSHLVWSALAGLGVGLLWRTRGWARLLAVIPPAAAILHHTLNNYAAEETTDRSRQWLETLDAKAWAVPLVCLAIAMVVDLRQLRHGKRTVPGVLLATERADGDGDSVGALVRYASWRLRWTLLIALRHVRLRRSLLYATALAPPDETEALRRAVAEITDRMNATDHPRAWRTEEIRTRLKAARGRTSGRRWLWLIPCVLTLPSLLFLGIGSFKSTSGLQDYFTTGDGPKILMGFGIAALVWIAWQLTVLLRTWQPTTIQPHGEPLATHRFRLGTALGGATTGLLLLYRGLGDAGPDGEAVPPLHLLDALDNFLVYLGFALLLLSLLALFPPGGFALAGVGVVGATTAPAAGSAALIGTAGVVLMAAAGAEGVTSGSSGGTRDVPEWLRDHWDKGRQFNKDNWHRYPANEIYLENGKYLDSYRPGKEIVSRKNTQISEIKPGTFRNYLNEIQQKYKTGTKIPDTAKARREYPELIGKRLRGNYYLEVPAQTTPVPEWALKDAANMRVIIRDVNGVIYKLPKG